LRKDFPSSQSTRKASRAISTSTRRSISKGVPKEVWDFHVGGYQVCEKWLKDRRGRQLSFDDLMHYQKVIVALKETLRLMEEVDRAIPGWPVQ
jgi:hypothetical protein